MPDEDAAQAILVLAQPGRFARSQRVDRAGCALDLAALQGEVRVEGAPDLRFGGIKMTFRPVAVPVSEGGGTRAIAAVNVDALRKQAAAKPAAAAAKGFCEGLAVFLLLSMGGRTFVEPKVGLDRSFTDADSP